MKLKALFAFLLLCFFLPFLCEATEYESSSKSSIVFTTLGIADYAFDVFTLPIEGPQTPNNEFQITDGSSVNFNGHFPNSPLLTSLISNRTQLGISGQSGTPSMELVYVTERNGSSSIYYDAVYYDDQRITSRFRSALEVPLRIQIPLLGSMNNQRGGVRFSMKDKPSVVGDSLVYVSTHEDPGVGRASWAAVYSTELINGLTCRLTPNGIADFSPAVSPTGIWTAVASYGDRGWKGEVEELSTDIYVFLTRDGTQRVKVVEHGGWPSWVDDSTLFFHRRNQEDNWISVYKAILPSHGPITTDSVIIVRVTPPGLHAFTPATSAGNNNFIAVATRRPSSKFRHIELFNLKEQTFKELTRPVSSETHHYNPFISPDGTQIGYHKCRGERYGGKSPMFLENIQNPNPNVSLFRIHGSYPSFSPSGDRIAYVDLPGAYVVNRDGSNRRKVFSETAFPTAWDWVREGVFYTSTGPTFASETTQVDVISINVDNGNLIKLTTNGENNAFPSPSPDGKWLVFRSGRTGHKNLYVMDAQHGESSGLYRLTEGPWSDTMCNWSPDGNWIAFSSDRENPGTGSFELFLIHPNGTGLRKLVQSGLSGRVNHPSFSPDGKTIVFTSDYGGISAEPISNPHHYQPYGDIYTVKLDGSDLTRLTHNSYEDGTPTWSPVYIEPKDVELSYGDDQLCDFEDCHWLSKMPNHGSMASNLRYTKAQCGA